MARLPIPMHEALFEGMNLGRFAYYLHKKPSYIHNVIQEYLKTNLAAISGLADSGVEIIFYFDDLGRRDRTILSKEAFHEFILPDHQEVISSMSQARYLYCARSCGFIDDLLPDMVDADYLASNP